MRRNILSGVLSVVSGKVLTLLVGLVATPLLYRLLGPAQFGEYTTVMSIHALFMIFVSSGVTNGVRKFIAEDRAFRNWEDTVAGFYFRMAVVLAILGALGYLGAVRLGLIAQYLGPSFDRYFQLMVLMVVAAQCWAYARRTLMGFGLERYSEPLEVLYHVTFAVVALTLVYYGFGVLGALTGQILGTALVGLIGLGLVVRRVSPRSMVLPIASDLPRRRMLTYNTMTVALTVFLMSLYHVDIIMLQTFVGSTQVGNYKTALTLAEFLWFVPVTLQMVYVHSTSELWSQGHYDRIERLASRTTRYTLLLTTVMALGLASLADVVVPLYWGPEATSAVVPLLFLLPGALGFAAVRPTTAIEEGHGTLRYSVIATGAAAVVNGALNLLLIPRFGMTGAAAATSVGYGSMFLFHVWSARKLEFDPLADARLVRVGLTVLLAAGPILWLPRVLPSDIVALVVVPPVGLAVFLTAAFLTGALTIRECLDLLSAFPDPIGSTVERTRQRATHLGMRNVFPGSGQFWLLIVGVLLFASGTGIAVVDMTAGDNPVVGATDDTTTPTGTPPSTATPEPTPTPESGTVTSTATSTQTTTPTETGTTTVTPTETETPTPTETETETATPTETQTETTTSTETETETETPTPTETDTETATQTETETATLTETETETSTEDNSTGIL